MPHLRGAVGVPRPRAASQACARETRRPHAGPVPAGSRLHSARCSARRNVQRRHATCTAHHAMQADPCASRFVLTPCSAALASLRRHESLGSHRAGGGGGARGSSGRTSDEHFLARLERRLAVAQRHLAHIAHLRVRACMSACMRAWCGSSDVCRVLVVRSASLPRMHAAAHADSRSAMEHAAKDLRWI